MKVLRFIIIFFAIVGLLIIGIGLAQPNTVEVKQQIMIDAPIDVVYEQIEVITNWENWLPLALDTSMIFSYSRNTKGEDAKLTWKNSYNNFGKIIIERSDKNQYLLTQFYVGDNQEPYMEPYFETAFVDGKVRLSMYYDFQSNWYDAFGKFYNNLLLKSGMEEMFALSLQNIKEISNEVVSTGYSLEIYEEITDEKFYITIKDSCGTNLEEFQAKFGVLFNELFVYLDNNEIPPYSPPTVFTHSYDEKNDKYIFSVALLISPDYASDIVGYEVLSIRKGKVVNSVSDGYYANIRDIYNKMYKYLEKNNLEQNAPSVELFTSNNPFESSEGSQIYITIPIK